jgi:hypothetical protein
MQKWREKESYTERWNRLNKLNKNRANKFLKEMANYCLTQFKDAEIRVDRYTDLERKIMLDDEMTKGTLEHIVMVFFEFLDEISSFSRGYFMDNPEFNFIYEYVIKDFLGEEKWQDVAKNLNQQNGS